MSAPTAGSITSLRRTPIPDIRPICALADAAEAVSRVAVANNGGIAPTNDNDNAAILASLSSASLLPNRGGNVVSPTSQLQLENPTSSFDSNSNTKRYKKKLCVIPMCTNGSVKGGVCVAHGARRHMNICHFKGCKKSMKVGDFCHTHVRRCDAPGCLRFVAHGEKCSIHDVAQPICKYIDQYSGGCTNVAHTEGYCQLQNLEVAAGNEENMVRPYNSSTHDSTSFTSDMEYRCKENGKRLGAGWMERQLTSSLDLLCSVTFQSLNEGDEVAEAKEDESKLPVSLTSKPSNSKKRLVKCGKCESCLRGDCGECKACLDKPKFGGRNTMRRRCYNRQCLNAQNNIETDVAVEEVEQRENDEEEESNHEEVEVAEDVATNPPESHVSKRRRIDRRGGNCGSCEACLRDDCGECMPCLDKLKFGGQNKMKRKCCMRTCLNKRDKVDEQAVLDKDTTTMLGDNSLCSNRRGDKLDSKVFVDNIKTSKLADDTKCLNSPDDMFGSNRLVDTVKTTRADGKSEGKRMKAELAKIKAELDARANGKTYGLKPPEYPTFNYATADGDEDDVEHEDEFYLSSDEDDETLGDDTSENVVENDEFMDSIRFRQSNCIAQNACMERGVTSRPSGKWQVQLYYAGASRYIGLFGSKEEACIAYGVARECMNSFSDLDLTPDQIMRNLDKLRKAAVSRGEFGLNNNIMDRYITSAELKGKELKTKGKIAKSRPNKETSSIDQHQVVETLTKAGPTKVKSDSGRRTAAVNAESRNCQAFVPYTKKPIKFAAGSQAETSSTKNCSRSPSQSKMTFRKDVPVTVVMDSGARAKSATNDNMSPIRSGPLLSVQPKATKEKKRSSVGVDIQKDGPEKSQKRTSMSSIYEKAMKLAEELPRGITIRPSGKWQVQVYYGGKSRYLGVFKSKLDAAAAYELARECCRTFERNPSPEQAKKNVILMREAAFTVETFESESVKCKKQQSD